ncbi:MAG: hypothetical protein CMP06_08865 [Xanthomonadales bacterium]|jgi:hypothetical protein|nr:hypothetical protein [Xanthomonadales bacterium]
MPLGGLIMMAKPPPAVRSAMEAAVDHAGLSDRLVSALFAPERWHQLLSGIHEDTPRTLETLIGVGNAIVADPVLMRFDRISSSGGELCSFLTHGEPPGFADLLSSVRSAMKAHGLDLPFRNRPQVTISYRAPTDLPSIQIEPVEWVLNSYVLVRRQGNPFKYEELKRWRLRPRRKVG